tara:strand:+ start:104 stop:289 length:186 start_codon:yes stop_codon:yes gene_type:complete
MFEMLSEYYKLNTLYLTNNFEEKCKKNYKELYFGATKYCIKEDNNDISSDIKNLDNMVSFK